LDVSILEDIVEAGGGPGVQHGGEALGPLGVFVKDPGDLDLGNRLVRVRVGLAHHARP